MSLQRRQRYAPPLESVKLARSDCAPVTHSPTLTHSLTQSVPPHSRQSFGIGRARLCTRSEWGAWLLLRSWHSAALSPSLSLDIASKAHLSCMGPGLAWRILGRGLSAALILCYSIPDPTRLCLRAHEFRLTDCLTDGSDSDSNDGLTAL